MALPVTITPLRALGLGGLVYGAGVVYMSRFYYKNSTLKQIYTSKDKRYGDLAIMSKSNAGRF